VQAGWLKQQKCSFSQFERLEVQDQSSGRVQFLVRTVFLESQLSGVFSQGLAHVSKCFTPESYPQPFHVISYNPSNPYWSGLTCGTSFNFTRGGLISKYSCPGAEASVLEN
jgi:hypothetical protein